MPVRGAAFAAGVTGGFFFVGVRLARGAAFAVEPFEIFADLVRAAGGEGFAVRAALGALVVRDDGAGLATFLARLAGFADDVLRDPDVEDFEDFPLAGGDDERPVEPATRSATPVRRGQRRCRRA